MTTCDVHASGDIALYFYDELAAGERAAVERHLIECSECRGVLDELRVIRAALANRPDVSAPASGDWTRFMSRLDASIAHEAAAVAPLTRFERAPQASYRSYLAIAALLALITFSVFIALQSKPMSDGPESRAQLVHTETAPPSKDVAAFASTAEEHFERSKLVVLGLAAKNPHDGNAADWAYERALAKSLLDDTRLYRLEAEHRGLDRLAGVMRDLELVLLQTSLTDEKDPAALPQLQRLIQRRDLIGKIDAATTTGL
jgi:hypothetical protein